MPSSTEARAITGHVTTRMTEHYSHVDAREKDAAVTGTSVRNRHFEDSAMKKGGQNL
jgi:hypothetical protein